MRRHPREVARRLSTLPSEDRCASCSPPRRQPNIRHRMDRWRHRRVSQEQPGHAPCRLHPARGRSPPSREARSWLDVDRHVGRCRSGPGHSGGRRGWLRAPTRIARVSRRPARGHGSMHQSEGEAAAPSSRRVRRVTSRRSPPSLISVLVVPPRLERRCQASAQPSPDSRQERLLYESPLTPSRLDVARNDERWLCSFQSGLWIEVRPPCRIRSSRGIPRRPRGTRRPPPPARKRGCRSRVRRCRA